MDYGIFKAAELFGVGARTFGKWADMGRVKPTEESAKSRRWTGYHFTREELDRFAAENHLAIRHPED